jgi:hypothetical protein
MAITALAAVMGFVFYITGFLDTKPDDNEKELS